MRLSDSEIWYSLIFLELTNAENYIESQLFMLPHAELFLSWGILHIHFYRVENVLVLGDEMLYRGCLVVLNVVEAKKECAALIERTTLPSKHTKYTLIEQSKKVEWKSQIEKARKGA